MSVIRSLSERRRRQAQMLEDLDAAVEASLDELAASRGDFDAQLAAVRALALAAESDPVPTEPLMALRAGLAARQAREHDRRRQMKRAWAMPGAAAAVAAGLIGYVGLTGGHSNSPSITVNNAANTLAQIDHAMASVKSQVAEGNRSAAASTGNQARSYMVQAQDEAASLPDGNPVRDVLLQAAETQIQQLQALLAQLQLQVKDLPPPPSGSSGSPQTTSSSQVAAGPTGSSPSQAGPTSTTEAGPGTGTAQPGSPDGQGAGGAQSATSGTAPGRGTGSGSGLTGASTTTTTSAGGSSSSSSTTSTSTTSSTTTSTSTTTSSTTTTTEPSSANASEPDSSATARHPSIR